MRPAGERQPYDGTTCAASTSAVRCGCCDYAVPDGRPSTCSSTSRASSTSSKSSASSRTHADRPSSARLGRRHSVRRTARGLTPSRGRRDPSGIDIVSAAGSVEPRRNWKLAQNGYLERRLSVARLRSPPAESNGFAACGIWRADVGDSNPRPPHEKVLQCPSFACSVVHSVASDLHASHP